MTIADLKNYGADTDDGLARCMGSQDLYLRLVNMSIDDSRYEKLAESTRSGDLKTAFETAHALKGILGNLSLTPLYQPVSELTEMLRTPQEGADYEPLLQQILSSYGQLKALVAAAGSAQ